MGSTAESVSVQAEVAQVEAAASSLGGLVGQDQMRELPLNGRDVEQLITLAPGVEAATSGTGMAFTDAQHRT